MENVKLYREILDLLEEHDCGFQVIEEMVKTMTSRIPKLEERIRKAQKQGQKTYISHLKMRPTKVSQVNFCLFNGNN